MKNHSSAGLSPIALFAFRRLEHTRLTVESLRNNDLAEQSSLRIFCDGPRTGADEADVEGVRNYVRSLRGFGDLQIVEHDQNLGLAQSIISGVTRVLSEQNTVIVVEDDLITSRYFLRYMNDALSLYGDNERVASAHGYIYPVDRKLPDTFFLRGADCWGWATWKRAWDRFEPDASVLLSQLQSQKLLDQFDLDGSYGFSDMLRAYAEGKNNSWAIRWHASAFLSNMFTLYPGQSLVNNIGMDASGTHCAETGDYLVQVRNEPVNMSKIPVEESFEAREAIKEFFVRQR